jgi:hypothetical protein
MQTLKIDKDEPIALHDQVAAEIRRGWLSVNPFILTVRCIDSRVVLYTDVND